MSETYPAGSTGIGSVSGYKYTRDADGVWRNDMLNGWYSGCVYRDNAVANGDLVDVVLPSAPAPEIKLGTVVEAAYDDDCDRAKFVCFAAEQDDPAFVEADDLAHYTYDAGDEAAVYLLSDLSDVTVNGVPLTPPVPEIEEPVVIGSRVTGHDGIWHIKVGENAWVRNTNADSYGETRAVVRTWPEVSAEYGPVTPKL